MYVFEYKHITNMHTFIYNYIFVYNYLDNSGIHNVNLDYSKHYIIVIYNLTCIV